MMQILPRTNYVAHASRITRHNDNRLVLGESEDLIVIAR